MIVFERIKKSERESYLTNITITITLLLSCYSIINTYLSAFVFLKGSKKKRKKN